MTATSPQGTVRPCSPPLVFSLGTALVGTIATTESVFDNSEGAASDGDGAGVALHKGHPSLRGLSLSPSPEERHRTLRLSNVELQLLELP